MTEPPQRVVTTELSGDLPDVLVVDDDPDVRAAIEDLVADAGFTVLAAVDGCQGLRFAQVWPPRLVLLDLQMPVLDGPAFLDRLRAHTRLAAIPVVVVSSDPIDPLIRDRVSAWISKPVDAERLLAVVSRLMCREDPASAEDADPAPAIPARLR